VSVFTKYYIHCNIYQLCATGSRCVLWAGASYGLGNTVIPTIYPTSRTQVSLAPTSTCYVNCLNTRKVFNCIFRSKVIWWLQIMLNYRPCYRNMGIQATQYRHSTDTKSSHGKMYSEKLHNINMYFHSYLFNYM
jgi:hypothetical protein